MNILGINIGWSRKDAGGTLSLNELMSRLDAAWSTTSGESVTPDTAMRSPTVLAIVTAISRRIATLPVHVYVKTSKDGRETKEKQPNHPVAKLLAKPNEWQTPHDYWLDATSTLVRWGNFYAFIGRGSTGPIRRLQPLCPSAVCVEQEQDFRLVYKARLAKDDSQKPIPARLIHHARGPARDFICGDSPVMDCREAIAMELAIEKFGAAFFANGAMPFVVFEFLEKSRGFKDPEQRKALVADFEAAFRAKNKFRTMVPPPGMKVSAPIQIQNNTAQFLESRKYQRTVIAGAFGVPPHMVGDLERGTFNNVEQQSSDFVLNVVLPYVRIFEAAMERDLLTDADRAGGVCIRFNLEGALRADFKTRQEGFNIMRQAGALTANEWREHEGMNPLPDGKGGDEVYQQGPSGQTTGKAPPAKPAGGDDAPKEDEPAA